MTWLKDGTPLNYSSRVYLQDTFNASLVFGNTTTGDSGKYQCIVENYKYQPSAVYSSDVATLKVTREFARCAREGAHLSLSLIRKWLAALTGNSVLARRTSTAEESTVLLATPRRCGRFKLLCSFI